MTWWGWELRCLGVRQVVSQHRLHSVTEQQILIEKLTFLSQRFQKAPVRNVHFSGLLLAFGSSSQVSTVQSSKCARAQKQGDICFQNVGMDDPAAERCHFFDGAIELRRRAWNAI